MTKCFAPDPPTPVPPSIMKLCRFALTLALSQGEREQYPLLLPPLPLGEGWGEGCFTLMRACHELKIGI